MDYLDLQASTWERQGQLLHAVNSAAVILLEADGDNYTSALHEGMALMANCIGVDRIYIWRNIMKDRTLHYIQEFEWLNPDGQPEMTVKHETGFSYRESIPEWDERFSRGECTNGPISSLSQIERDRLAPYGILSILVIPIHLQGRFWGFVSFDDCQKSRTFTEDEVDILRSGSLMIASAMHRHETAAKMHEADERMKLMLDATPLCCNMWNKELHNIDCNAEAVKLFELKDKQEYLDRFFELSPEYQPDGQLSSEKARQFILKAFEQEKVIFEWMHQKLDGTPIPSEITLVRVRQNGEYIVTGYTRDLREYKKMTREKERKDAMLHMVNDIAAILLQSEMDDFEANLWHCMGMMAKSVEVDRIYIWENHVEDGQLYTTQRYEWSEGAEPRQDNECTVSIPYSEIATGLAETLSGGSCINGIIREMRQEWQDQLSTQGVLSILMVPLFLRDQFWGFIGFDDCHRERTFTDNEMSILRSGSLLITNALLRNEMTRRTRDAAAKMEAVISNYAGIIFSVDANNVITLFNGLFLNEIGISPSFLEGKRLELAREKNRHQDILENVTKTLSTGPQDWISEIDGKMFRAHTTPIVDENGLATGVVGTLDDITDTVRMQKELETAVEEAQAASRAKSEFLSNMSHEIRTPMNAIIGMTSIGKSAQDIEKKNYAFKRIENASGHLLGVINDILDMSKIEAGKLTLSEAEFDFEAMVKQVININSYRIDEKQQHFTVQLDQDIPRALIGDDQRISQVITNLLSNAVKFTPEHGEIRLSARFLKEEAGVCTIQIDVSDTGIGISEQQQARLFQSFEQAESSTSRKFGGTGLGLAISKHIVERMGGKIWVESELEKGATFFFTIQARRGQEKAQDSEDRPFAADAGPVDAGSFAGCCILLAEDVEINQEIVRTILEPMQLQIDCAMNGAEAVRMFSDAPARYDMIFMDVQMPEMDGLEATRRIRALGFPKAAEIPIIAMTANVFREDIEKCLESGMNGHVGKPLDFNEVIEKLQRYLHPPLS